MGPKTRLDVVDKRKYLDPARNQTPNHRKRQPVRPKIDGCGTCCSSKKESGDTPNLEAQEPRSAVAAVSAFHGTPLHQELWPAPCQLQEQDVRRSCYAVEDHALWKQ